MNQKQIGKFISATRRQKVMILTQRVLCLQFKLDIFTSNWKTTSSDLFYIIFFIALRITVFCKSVEIIS